MSRLLATIKTQSSFCSPTEKGYTMRFFNPIDFVKIEEKGQTLDIEDRYGYDIRAIIGYRAYAQRSDESLRQVADRAQLAISHQIFGEFAGPLIMARTEIDRGRTKQAMKIIDAVLAAMQDDLPYQDPMP